jgi:2-phosphoglycerate kinase
MLILPEETVFQVGQLDYVKVVVDGELRNRLVQIGANNIVRKGVTEGEELVIEPLRYK